jgi:hypothetical protein
MTVLFIILGYGTALSLLLSALLLTMIRANPRLMLQDYPKDIQAPEPPKAPTEQRQTRGFGAVLLRLALAFPVAAALSAKAARHGSSGSLSAALRVPFLFNVVDWLILDWLIFCTFTPTFAVLPGTEGMARYKKYAMHFRGFLIGTVLSSQSLSPLSRQKFVRDRQEAPMEGGQA